MHGICRLAGLSARVNRTCVRALGERLVHTLRKIGFGFALPLRLLAAVRADGRLRDAYARVVIVQVLGVLLVFGVSLKIASEPARELVAAITNRAPTEDHGDDDVQVTVRDGNVDVRTTKGDEDEPEEADKHRGPGIHVVVSDDDAKKSPHARGLHVREARGHVPGGLRAGWPRLARALEALGRLYARLVLAEWIVIALSRDFHDQLSREVSLLAALPPEDPESTPRVRLNVAWLKKRLRRKLVGGGLNAMGFPVVAVLSWPLSLISDVLSYGLLTSVWSAYWLLVFLAGKTGYAWSDASAGEPWFVRLVAPLERFAALRWYPRLVRKLSANFYSPAAMVARTPLPFVGLAIVRALSAVPLVYLALRPLFPVASGKILQAAGVPLRLSAEPAPVSAEAPAAVPAGVAASA